MRAQQVDHLLELRGRTPVETLVPEAAWTAEIDEGPQFLRGRGQALSGTRELQLHAGVLEHGQIRQAARLEHVAHRIVTLLQTARRVVRSDPEAHPQREKAA